MKTIVLLSNCKSSQIGLEQELTRNDKKLNLSFENLYVILKLFLEIKIQQIHATLTFWILRRVKIFTTTTIITWNHFSYSNASIQLGKP